MKGEAESASLARESWRWCIGRRGRRGEGAVTSVQRRGGQNSRIRARTAVLAAAIAGCCLPALADRPAMAAEERDFALVEIGGVTLGIPREWVLDPNKGWGAGSRDRSVGRGLLEEALSSPEPISISDLHSCCREGQLAPIYPDPVPYGIFLSTSPAPDAASGSIARRARALQDAKKNREELFRGFRRSAVSDRLYMFEREVSDQYFEHIREIRCPDENFFPPEQGLDLACSVYFVWKNPVTTKYMFRRSQYNLQDIKLLDDIVVNLLSQLEQWGKRNAK